jgi:hypothetical protein
MEPEPLATKPIARECFMHRKLKPPITFQNANDRQVEPVRGLEYKTARFDIVIGPTDFDVVGIAGPQNIAGHQAITLGFDGTTFARISMVSPGLFRRRASSAIWVHRLGGIPSFSQSAKVGLETPKRICASPYPPNRSITWVTFIMPAQFRKTDIESTRKRWLI